MKKAFKIVGIVFAALLLLLIVVPMALRGKIETIVKQQANGMLDARLDFDKLSISLIRNFPQASVSLDGLRIEGVGAWEGCTLVAADHIRVGVNLLSLFGDSGFEVSRVILDSPQVTAVVNSRGEVNWDIMKSEGGEPAEEEPEEEPEEAAGGFRLKVNRVKIDNARIVYVDSTSVMGFATERLSLRASGDLSAARSELKFSVSTDGTSLYMGGVPMLSKESVGVSAAVDADMENGRYTLSGARLSLNEVGVEVNGWVALADDKTEMDLSLDAAKVGFRELLSIVPGFYTKEFKNLSASGSMSLAAWVKGEMKGESMPAYGVTLSVADGSFKYAGLPMGVEKINLDLKAGSQGGSLDNTVVDLSRLSLAMGGNPFAASLYVATPMSDPRFKASADGKLDLGMIGQVYPLPDSVTLSGEVTAAVKVAARMSDVEKLNYPAIDASGTLAVSGVSAKVSGLPEVRVERIAAGVAPAALSLSECRIKVGGSDLSAQGSLSDYLGYVLNGKTLNGKLNVSSQLLDLNELMGIVPESGEETQAAAEEPESGAQSTGAFIVPKNLNLAMTASLGKILFQQMTITDLAGAVSVRGGELKLEKLDMNAFGGQVATSGAYSTAVEGAAPALALDAAIRGASFSETFKQLDLVRKIVPLFEQAGGNYTMSLNMTARLNDDMSPDLNSVNARGVLRSQDIQLQNIGALSKLGEALKSDKFKQIEARDVNIEFTVADGRLTTAPFDLKLSDNVSMNLSGSTGLDQTIDYVGRVSLPEGFAGGYLGNVNVKIGGTFTSPTVSLDLKSAAQEAVSNAVNEQLSKITGRDTSLGEEFEKQAEKLRDEARKAGEKLVAAAQAEGDKLIEKAGDSKLKQVAARKSAEALVKKAQEQADKLNAEAEEKIAALKAKNDAAE